MACSEAAEEVANLFIVEARERQVVARVGLELGQQACQELLVPGARDLVEGESEEPGLIDGDVEPADRDGRKPQATGGDEALVAADNRPVLPPSEDRLDEAELAQAPLEGVELDVTDPAGVRRVRLEVVDRDVGNSNW